MLVKAERLHRRNRDDDRQIAKQLRRWVTLIYRIKAKRKGRKTYPMPTPAQVLWARRLVKTTSKTYKEISQITGVGNDGRMSEIIRGKRGKQVYDRKGRRK